MAKRATGKTISKLEGMAKDTLQMVTAGKSPYLQVPTRTLANVRFNEKSRLIELKGDRQKRFFFNVGQAKKFMQTFLVADACKELPHVFPLGPVLLGAWFLTALAFLASIWTR